MGAIVSDFEGLPADGATPGEIAARQRAYAGVYEDLAALGLPVPVQASNVVTRAQLLAHLQAQAGALIKAELAGDPEARGYGAGDAADAVTLAADFVPGGVARFPGSNATGYRVAAGSTDTGLVLVLNPGGGAPGLLAVSGLANGMLRFRQTATTVANRGAVMTIKAVPNDTTITLDAPLPGVPTVGDVLDCGLVRPTRLPGRLGVILRRLPYSPNIITAADVAAAKV